MNQSTRDSRVRHYVAPVRVVRGVEVSGSELLPDGAVQSYVYDGQPLCRIAPGGEILLDFGREIAGGVRIVTAPNGCAVSRATVTFGESVSEALGIPDADHAVHRTTLDLPPTGMTEYGNTGFRFVRIEVPSEASRPLDLIGVVAVSLLRDLPRVGAFESSDGRLNRIWEVGADTVHLCMQDYIYDGVKRDRMVWLGDLYPEMRTVFSVFGAVETVEESLAFALDHTPPGRWINGISSYSAWFLVCCHALYRQTGDEGQLRRYLGEIRAIARQLMACIDSDGQERLDGMRFLDWPTDPDAAAVHAGLQGLLAWSLDCAAQLAFYGGDDELFGACRRAVAALRAAHLPPTANKSAAAMLVAGGLLDPRRAEAEAFGRSPEEGLSTFFGTFVLDARARAHRMPKVLDSVRRYWGGMLDCGATSFWEDFDLKWLRGACRIDEIPDGSKVDIHREKGSFCYRGWRHSLCHGWGGGVTAFLSEALLGVRMLSPGFRTVEIRPEFGGLSYLSGRVPTPFGPIEVEGSPDDWTVRCPEGVQYSIPEKCRSIAG